MPLALTLCLDADGAAAVEALWRDLAARGIADDCLRQGYRPHVTLCAWPEDAPADLPDAAFAAVREWKAMPVHLAAFGVFAGPPSVLWLAPAVSPDLAARRAALDLAACDAHHGPEAWVPHVTLTAGGRAAEALGALLTRWRGPLRAVLDRVDLVRFPPVSVLRSAALGTETCPGQLIKKR